MKKIAIGVLTYNHPDVVQDILGRVRNIYSSFSDFGVDIYYLDSSEDQKTEAIVENSISSGFSNLHYVRVPFDDYKLMYFLQGKYFDEEYEYYWPIKDRVIFDIKTMLMVYNAALSGKYALIMVDGYGKDMEIDGTTREYLDIVEFYRDYGWETTSLDVSIFSKRLLDIYDWPKEIPVESPLYSFLQVDVVFRGLSDWDDPRVYVLREPDTVIYNHTGASSMWIRDTILVWKNRWVGLNDNLPHIYDGCKDSVIRGKALPWTLTSEEGFRELFRLGIINKDNIEDVLDGIERITSVPRDRIRDISA